MNYKIAIVLVLIFSESQSGFKKSGSLLLYHKVKKEGGKNAQNIELVMTF